MAVTRLHQVTGGLFVTCSPHMHVLDTTDVCWLMWTYTHFTISSPTAHGNYSRNLSHKIHYDYQYIP